MNPTAGSYGLEAEVMSDWEVYIAERAHTNKCRIQHYKMTFLTEEQKQHWLAHGFVKIPKCFSREAANAYTSSIWTRLGVSPTDKLTWTKERVNMPGLTVVNVKDFAPKAWEAICELAGDEDRLTDWCRGWRDAWIINMGKPEYKPDEPTNFRTLDNWHNDGDWFTHFLDSGEQGLLVIPLFSDIKPKGGGTVICTDGIGLVAEHLVRYVLTIPIPLELL